MTFYLFIPRTYIPVHFLFQLLCYHLVILVIFYFLLSLIPLFLQFFFLYDLLLKLIFVMNLEPFKRLKSRFLNKVLLFILRLPFCLIQPLYCAFCFIFFNLILEEKPVFSSVFLSVRLLIKCKIFKFSHFFFIKLLFSKLTSLILFLSFSLYLFF